jgi:hypothetical protein
VPRQLKHGYVGMDVGGGGIRPSRVRYRIQPDSPNVSGSQRAQKDGRFFHARRICPTTRRAGVANDSGEQSI